MYRNRVDLFLGEQAGEINSPVPGTNNIFFGGESGTPRENDPVINSDGIAMRT